MWRIKSSLIGYVRGMSDGEVLLDNTEAQSAAALNHPAIVAVYDSGEEELTQPDGSTRFYVEVARPDGAHDLVTSVSR